MKPELLSQLMSLIDSSHSILLTTRQHADYDEVATALAWLQWLRQKHKTAELVIDTDNLSRFDWLPESKQITLCEHQKQTFTIKIKTDDFKLGELSYSLEGDHIEIYLKPKEGKIASDKVEQIEQTFPYDLIITLGSPELRSLGKVFDEYRAELQKTPIINIGRRPDNTNYGQLNVVELTATSLAEVSYPIMKSAMTKEIAYYLLTALISATKSFQTAQVTPSTLLLASELMIAGAPRDEIVLCLYRNRDISTLKFWGVILSRLEQSGHIIYSYISQSETGDTTIDLEGLSNELILTGQTADIAVLFYEKAAEETVVHVFAKENFDIMALLEQYQPQGTSRSVSFVIRQARSVAQAEVIKLLSDKLKLIHG